MQMKTLKLHVMRKFRNTQNDKTELCKYAEPQLTRLIRTRLMKLDLLL